MEATDTSTPLSAAWLGGLGAAPFVGLAGVTPFLTGAPRLLVTHALLGYGAVILSFLGGVHWGLAIPPGMTRNDREQSTRLAMSVIPSLAAWSALVVPEKAGLVILAVCVAAMLWVDIRATRAGWAPPWYPKLRVPLSGVVAASLLFAAFA